MHVYTRGKTLYIHLFAVASTVNCWAAGNLYLSQNMRFFFSSILPIQPLHLLHWRVKLEASADALPAAPKWVFFKMIFFSLTCVHRLLFAQIEVPLSEQRSQEKA